jgi:DNA invertase Pin-like site-specific DNA recombinase
MRVAIYARVSRLDQEPENQLHELRRYVQARGWDAAEFVEHGVSGAKDRRPVLDAMLADVRRRRFDAVVCWKLDRLGRNMRHLVTLLDELRALEVAFVTIGEGLDTTTPAGRMTFGIFAAVAEFERERTRERILLALDRRRARGLRLGRARKMITKPDLLSGGDSHQHVATQLGLSVGTIRRRRAEIGIKRG